MRRREFIAGLGSAAAWPAVGRAQQAARRVGVLMYRNENDPDMKARLSGLTRALAELGWVDGRNLSLDVRWAATNIERARTFAKELVDLRPDVIVTASTPMTAVIKRQTQTIPTVFVGISDPVGVGFVSSLSRPAGNLTGFINVEASMGGKWLELLKEIAPGTTRVAILFSPDIATGSYYMPSFEAAARSFKLLSIKAPVRSDAEIEATIASFGREPGGGLILPPDGFTNTHRAQIAMLAVQKNLPSVSADAVLAREGGLLAYGPEPVDIWRRSASYVDRILRGAKPSELPVQLPVKFEMTLNLKTGKALGLTVPQSILLRADEVIE